MENSCEFMAGQRLMFGFDGTGLNPDLKEIIRDFRAGGIILFSRNVESPDQLTRLCTDAQSFAADCGQPPLFIGIDQEGGAVARLKAPYTEFPGNPHIRTLEDAAEFARITADELGRTGVNMDLAPVLDVVPDGFDSIMKKRMFPGPPHRVAELGCQVIKTLQENGIMAVAKHFPGIGRTVLDSHFELPVLEADAEEMAKGDLLPFEAAAGAGVAGMMLSHIFYPRLDPQWQASLSPAIADGLLRGKMGFQGLSITDDLDMKAIRHDIPTCIRQILAAGIDLTLICHKGPNIRASFEEMVRLLDTDPVLRKTGETCLERILRFKREFLG